LARGERAVAGERRRLLRRAVDASALARLWAHRLARRVGGVDRREVGGVERSFTRDELLTNVMIYWLTGSIGSSMQYYWAHRHAPPVALRPERIEVPTGIALFPKEVTRPPRSAVERKYAVTRWTEMSRGGHFPAL